MAFVEDPAPFLPDFGVAATVGGVSLTGIFDNNYADPFGMVASSSPALLIVSSAAPSVAVGNTVVVGGVSYSVAEIQPDGTGLARLMLKS